MDYPRRSCIRLGGFLAGITVVCLLGPLHCSCQAQETVVLVGSGSTVPLPLYNRWSKGYNKRSAKVHMRYLPVSAREGIDHVSHRIGDFAAGEVPLTARERTEFHLIEVPAVLVGIVPIYNLPRLNGELRFSGGVLADIFLGRVRFWNSPSLARLNPDLALPNLPIKVVYRPAGKGTNYIFSDFLSKVSPDFRTEIGVTSSPRWPVGDPAERSSDMAAKVGREPGSIGYVEVQYAIKTQTPFGSVLNPAGHFVRASKQTLDAACRAVEAPAWDKMSVSLTNAPGPDSFPITGFSWVYLRTDLADASRAAALADFLGWMLTDGQQIATDEGYAQVPLPLVSELKRRIHALQQIPGNR